MAQANRTPQPPTATGDPQDPVMVGGPGLEPPEPNPQPAPGEEVTINGQRFTVDPGLAAAMRDREGQFSSKLNDHDRELGELRKFRQDYQTPPTRQAVSPATDDGETDNQFFEAPTKTVRQMIKEEVSLAEGRVRGEMTKKESQDLWWSGFWRPLTPG